MGRFSALALAGVAALLAGGILQSLLQLDAVDDLVGHRLRARDPGEGRPRAGAPRASARSTAAASCRRSTARPRTARRRAARARCCGARCGPRWRSGSRPSPPRARSPATRRGRHSRRGPYSASAALGPARAELTVEPAQAGPNELHLYLFDANDGTQYDAPRDLAITAALPERRDRADRARGPQGRPGPLRGRRRAALTRGGVAARAGRPDLRVRRAADALRGAGAA